MDPFYGQQHGLWEFGGRPKSAPHPVEPLGESGYSSVEQGVIEGAGCWRQVGRVLDMLCQFLGILF